VESVAPTYIAKGSWQNGDVLECLAISYPSATLGISTMNLKEVWGYIYCFIWNLFSRDPYWKKVMLERSNKPLIFK